MQFNQAGLSLIQQQEGLVLHAYKDQIGVWTIGYGNTYYPPYYLNGRKVQQGDLITQQQADDFLNYVVINDVANVIRKFITAALNDNQFSALCSFSYNLGAGALEHSTLLKVLNANPEDPEIRVEFGKWVYAGGKVLDDLVNRRKAEADLYFS
jgi:lysozyme